MILLYSELDMGAGTSPELHAFNRSGWFIVPYTMEGEHARASGMQPQGPLQSALPFQIGLGPPDKQGLTPLQGDRGFLCWLRSAHLPR